MPRAEMNPKDLAAKTRVPMHLLPSAGAVHGAMACRDGAVVKGYGPYNWRDKPISLMEYIGAMERHIAWLKAGSWYNVDAPMVTHLGSINATSSIILDAHECGTLIDDRPKVEGHTNDTLIAYAASMKQEAVRKRVRKKARRSYRSTTVIGPDGDKTGAVSHV